MSVWSILLGQKTRENHVSVSCGDLHPLLFSLAAFSSAFPDADKSLCASNQGPFSPPSQQNANAVAAASMHTTCTNSLALAQEKKIASQLDVPFRQIVPPKTSSDAILPSLLQPFPCSVIWTEECQSRRWIREGKSPGADDHSSKLLKCTRKTTLAWIIILLFCEGMNKARRAAFSPAVFFFRDC